MPLPIKKNEPIARMGKVWIYGDAKVGKSTTAAELNPDTTFVIDTEGGTLALNCYSEQVREWEDFRRINTELKAGGHPFDTVVVDTVDVLSKLCADYTLRGLSGNPTTYEFRHASDFEYGKGWEAITNEFSLRVAQMCSTVDNAVFISHAAEETIKERNGRERQVARPSLAPKGLRQFLEGFVDRIIFAELIPSEDGEQRVLRTAPSSSWLAGGRTPRGVDPLPETLPMDGAGLREALENLTAVKA